VPCCLLFGDFGCTLFHGSDRLPCSLRGNEEDIGVDAGAPGGRGLRTDHVASKRWLRCRVKSGCTAREVSSFPRSGARRRLAAPAVPEASPQITPKISRRKSCSWSTSA